MTEKVIAFPDHINDATDVVEECRRKGGDALVSALEAVVIGNLLKRHHDGPIGGVLKLIFCAESLFGPLGFTIRPSGETPAGFPILIELPENIRQVTIGGRVFVEAA